MQVSSRQRRILELLLNRDGDMTISDIAREIQVSSRTVHRELPDLESLLAAYGIALRKKSGFGIQLQAEAAQLEALEQSLSISGRAIDYSTDERKVMIACELLSSDEPTKLFALAHQLRVAVPTVAGDLDQVDEWIGRHGLTLVRRRGYGVQLEGTEAAKRRAILQIIQEYLDDSAIFGHTADLPPPSPLTSRLLSMLGKENLMQVEQALWGLEEQGLSELSENDYTALLLQISIAVNRIRQGHEIRRDDSLQDETFRDGRDSREIAHPHLRHLSEALQLNLSSMEAGYFSELLHGDHDAGSSRLLPRDDLTLMERVQRLIRMMEEMSGAPLHADRSLRDGLLNHIEPVLERIREGTRIRNPLLAQIKKNYTLLFQWVRQAVDQTFDRLVIPDEEIGFLVMHFGAALERLKQHSRPVKAIIVCTSGIGSSKLLAVRLGKEMPQIEILEHVSWYEASRIPKDTYDIIISTVDLPLGAGPYIKLSPLLTKEEVDKLRRYIHNLPVFGSVRVPGPITEKHPLQQLLQAKAYLDQIVTLIEQFEVFDLQAEMAPVKRGKPGKQDREALRLTLTQLCEAINTDRSITRIEPVVELLLEREKYGTQVIPDTRLALLHTRSEWILKPILSTFRLSEPFLLNPEQPTEVAQIVLMLGPLELSKESLEVLSEISAMLLLPELISTLETGTAQDIKHFLAKELFAFFTNLTKNRES